MSKTDSISRQLAIEKLERNRSLFCKNRVEFQMLSATDKSRVDEIDTCIAELLNLPSAQPEITLESAIDYLCSIGWMQEHDRIMSASAQQWIPRSEPPKSDGFYIVYAPYYTGGSSTAKEHHDGVMFSKYKKGKWSIEHGYYNRDECVKAWTPLPLPWKGES